MRSGCSGVSWEYMPLWLLQFCLLLLKFSTIAIKFVVLPSLSFLKADVLEQEEYKRIPSLRYVLLFQSTEPHCRRSYICNYTRLYLVILSSPSPIFFVCLFVCLLACLFVFSFFSLCCRKKSIFLLTTSSIVLCWTQTKKEKWVPRLGFTVLHAVNGWAQDKSFLCGVPATIISDIKGAWHLWQLKSLW